MLSKDKGLTIPRQSKNFTKLKSNKTNNWQLNKTSWYFYDEKNNDHTSRPCYFFISPPKFSLETSKWNIARSLTIYPNSDILFSRQNPKVKKKNIHSVVPHKPHRCKNSFTNSLRYELGPYNRGNDTDFSSFTLATRALNIVNGSYDSS